MNKKIILGLSVLLVALFTLIGGASYAWLTSQGDAESNTYTVGKVSYTVTKKETTGYVVPGQSLVSDITLTNNSNIDTHLRVVLSVVVKDASNNDISWTIGSDAKTNQILMKDTVTANWTLDDDGKLYYGEKANPTNIADGENVVLSFSGLVLNGALVGNEHSGYKVTVVVKYQAKQADVVKWEDLASETFNFSTGLDATA